MELCDIKYLCLYLYLFVVHKIQRCYIRFLLLEPQGTQEHSPFGHQPWKAWRRGECTNFFQYIYWNIYEYIIRRYLDINNFCPIVRSSFCGPSELILFIIWISENEYRVCIKLRDRRGLFGNTTYIFGLAPCLFRAYHLSLALYMIFFGYVVNGCIWVCLGWPSYSKPSVWLTDWVVMWACKGEQNGQDNFQKKTPR